MHKSGRQSLSRNYFETGEISHSRCLLVQPKPTTYFYISVVNAKFPRTANVKKCQQISNIEVAYKAAKMKWNELK